jgi:excinuclease ABC subunit B
MVKQVVYVSATPGKYELAKSESYVVEQIIRPTGLTDPQVLLRPGRGAVDDLYGEIRARLERGGRVLVTTLTKRMAEDLTEYYEKLGVRVQYLHSDIDALERVEILRQLRLGEFDVLVGINLLREGLDIPECSLVAILDADKEGFLRSQTSLIQTIGRASRNIEGTVILYADVETASIKFALLETERRRKIQEAFNKDHHITPASVVKNIQGSLYAPEAMDYVDIKLSDKKTKYRVKEEDIPKELDKVEKMMKKAAKNLEFEKAATLRDRLFQLKKHHLGI